jgi:hypothetical protein
MAEELGKGLQNPVHGCESRSRLHVGASNSLRDEGRVAELVYAADLKSVAARLEGSSPSLPTKNTLKGCFYLATVSRARCTS